MVSDGAAGAIVVWRDYRDLRSPRMLDIYAQHFLASGAIDPKWPATGLAICPLPGNQGFHSVASDGAGGVIIGWSDWRNGPYDGMGDLYAQHVLATGVVDPAWPVDGCLVSNATGDQEDPQLVSDGAGGAIVAWSDRRNRGEDIYAQHVLGSGVVDPKWPAEGRALCTASGGQDDHRIAEDGAGGAFVVWTDAREDLYDIYAQHVLASGTVNPAWPLNGLALCTAREDQGNVSIVTDDQGGAIVSWIDARTGAFPYYSGYIDIYAQHVLPSGVVDPTWPAEGRAVCDTIADQGPQAMVSDGSGGAIIAWVDARSQRWDIYAHHLLASGVLDPAWPRQGRALREGFPGATYVPAITTDGCGGAIVAWADGRAGSSDIYAQHIRASGTLHPAWPENAQGLCTASGNQYDVTIVGNNAGQTIVAWADYRGDGDIYATRVHTPGGADPPRPARRDALRLRLATPMSASGGLSVSFDVPSHELVTVEVFDLAGRAIRTLTTREEMSAGTHNLAWDGADSSGGPVRRGVYLVRVSAGPTSVTGKILVLR